MEYILARASLGYRLKSPISEEKFQELKTAHVTLFQGLQIEEKYDLLIENYIEFEESQIKLALQHAIRTDFDYWQAYQNRSILNRRLSNLLSSTYLYLKSYEQHLKKIYSAEGKSSEAIESVKNLVVEYEKTNNDFKIMNLLRHHSQHCGLPVHFVSWNSKVIEDSESTPMLEFTLDYSTYSDEVRKGRRDNANALKEAGDNVDLKPAVRKYIECIGTIHKKIQDYIAPIIAKAREAISSEIELYKQKVDPDTVGLTAFAVTEDGKRKTQFTLMLDWDNVRITLQDRNRILKKLSSLYITSKVTPAKKATK